jgi:hypothetical protein
MDGSQIPLRGGGLRRQLCPFFKQLLAKCLVFRMLDGDIAAD